MLSPGCIVKSRYRIERLLGSGGMGKVYLCTNLDLGNKWALKHIKLDGLTNVSLSEAEILKKVNHILLPKIVDFFYDESGIYIVQTYIEGVSLDKKLLYFGSIDEEKALDWILQLCDVLSYLHNMEPAPIVHRDLKPSNIMVTPDDRLVLIDFGIAKEYIYNQMDKIQGGTCTYSAPEQLMPFTCTDQRADIYCLGVLLMELLTGVSPEQGQLDSSRTGWNGSIKSLLLKNIIGKCTRARAAERYENIELLKSELQAAKNVFAQRKLKGKIKMWILILLSIILSFITYCISIVNLILP